MREQDFLILAIAVSFVTVGTLASVWGVITTSGSRPWTIIGVAGAAIVPTMLFGGLSHPQFVYVNLCVVLLACLLLRGKGGLFAVKSPACSRRPHAQC